jgi:hypothetical protein
MVTEAVLPTGVVETGKVAVVAFAPTVTLAGTCAAEALLLDKVTTAPFVGAALLNVTVPVEEVPPTTDEGLIVTEFTTFPNTARPAVRFAMYVAEIVAETVVETGLVVTVNVAVVAFAATVTLAGTCAAAVLLLDKVTTAPPAGAGPVSVTVAVEVFPPVTEVGFMLSEVRDAAETVNVPVLVAP